MLSCLCDDACKRSLRSRSGQHGGHTWLRADQRTCSTVLLQANLVNEKLFAVV